MNFALFSFKNEYAKTKNTKTKQGKSTIQG
jgi:hypothetical protein